ncbi:plexin-A3-like, partial [Littorina saxatilis]
MEAPESFTFLQDPDITQVSPKRSFVSGGITITMKGVNLHAAQQPMLGAKYKGTDTGVFEVCTASLDGSVMKCPALNLKHLVPDQTNNPEVLDLYVKLDGVTLLEQNERLRHFQYFPDPDFRSFPPEDGKLKVFDVNDQEVELLGQNLHSGFSMSDVIVTIGGLPCNVTEKTQSVLKCKPTFKENSINDQTRLGVQIQVGRLRFNTSEIGYVKFIRSTISAALSAAVIAIIIVIVLVIIAVGILFFVMRRKKIYFFKTKGREPSIAYTAGHQTGLDGVDSNGTRTYSLEARENDYFDRGQVNGAEASSPLLGMGGIDSDILKLMENESLLIDKECLTLGEEVGKGNFGCVKRGFLTLPEQKGDILVAIKTLHNNNPRPIELQSFLQE